jgi:hypothetical protein
LHPRSEITASISFAAFFSILTRDKKRRSIRIIKSQAPGLMDGRLF